MRGFIMAALLLLALPLCAEEKAAERSAAEKYNSGDYLGAVELYQQEAEADPGNPYVLYNLANSYFKSGDGDKALVYYFRAFKILPRDADIRHNLSFALQSTGQKLVPDGIPDMAFNLYHYYSLAELKGLCALFAWLSAILLMIYLFGGKNGKVKGAVLICGGIFILLGIWLLARYPSDTQRVAVVTVPRAELRSGPGDNFPVSVTVPRAHLLLIEDGKGEWDKVSIKDTNSSGWVLNKSIEEI